MASRVIVHIGTMKSATTYVQDLASVNLQRLAEQGVLWPEADLPFLALADLLGRDEDRPGRAGTWLELVSSFSVHPGAAVFSNELLAPLGAARIKQVVTAFQPATVEVLLTARDLGRVIPSHWQTTLKNGSTTPWTQFAAAVCTEPAPLGNVSRRTDLGSWFWRRHDVPGILARWQRFVPSAQITVVTVPPAGSEPRVITDRFFRALDVSAADLEPPDHENASVGAHSAELLRRLNEAAPDLQRHHYRWGVKEALVRRSLASRAASEPRFGLAQEQHLWVRRRADRMIEEIQASGVRVIGDLDDLKPAEGNPDGVVDPADASDAELLQAAVQGLAGMVNVVGEMQLEQERVLRQAVEPPRR